MQGIHPRVPPELPFAHDKSQSPPPPTRALMSHGVRPLKQRLSCFYRGGKSGLER